MRLATREQRARLPQPDQTGQLFGAEVVARLARDAGVPDTKIPSFGDGLRCAVEAYLRDARRLDAGKIRDAIEILSRAVEEALYALVELPVMEHPGAVGKAIDALAALPTEARAFLDRLASATRDNIPEPSDLCDSQKQYQALVSLYGLCGSRMEIVPGRKRPGGKRSKARLEIEVASPPVPQNRPRNWVEFFLCVSLGQLYFDATGRMPFRGRRVSDRGPFVRLIKDVFSAIGIQISADDLVRSYLGFKDTASG